MFNKEFFMSTDNKKICDHDLLMRVYNKLFNSGDKDAIKELNDKVDGKISRIAVKTFIYSTLFIFVMLSLAALRIWADTRDIPKDRDMALAREARVIRLEEKMNIYQVQQDKLIAKTDEILKLLIKNDSQNLKHER